MITQFPRCPLYLIGCSPSALATQKYILYKAKIESYESDKSGNSGKIEGSFYFPFYNASPIKKQRCDEIKFFGIYRLLSGAMIINTRPTKSSDLYFGSSLLVMKKTDNTIKFFGYDSFYECTNATIHAKEKEFHLGFVPIYFEGVDKEKFNSVDIKFFDEGAFDAKYPDIYKAFMEARGGIFDHTTSELASSRKIL